MECDPIIKGLQVTKRRRWILNLQSDSRIKRKLYEADVDAKLETAAELVGMGGHKEEAHTVIKDISDELKKIAMARHKTPTGKVRKAPDLKILKDLKKPVPEVWLQYIDQGHRGQMLAYRYLDPDIMHRYCARDALTTFYLEEWCNDRLIENENLHMVWEEIAKPAMWAWCSARLAGFPVDKKRVELLADYLNVEIEKLGRQIEAHEPGLNPNSPQQVVAALEKRGFRSKRTTATGKTKMDKAVMEEFKGKHPLVDLIIAWKMFRHTQDNFVEGLIPYIRSDGKCHPSYLQDGTETGRPSSADPNFFNRLKGRDEESRKLGTMLRECHIMPPGHTLIEADEGQIEIREVMDLCGDPTGIEIITSGVDFHLASAKRFAAVLGKDPEKVSDIDREHAKTSNFAAIYELPDQLGFMLSKRIGISSKSGNELATALFGAYKNLLPWMDQKLADATANGYSVTRWRGKEARHRPLWHLGLPAPGKHDRDKSEDKTRWQNHARSSWNGEAQGSAVDIITSMLWRLQLWLDANTDGGRFVLQIYDSIMVIVKDEDVDKTIAYLHRLMTDMLDEKIGYLRSVPLAIDVKIGKSWGQMRKVVLPKVPV
jgi:DNA polymerase-1